MKAATGPREDPLRERLLVIVPDRDRHADATIAELPTLLRRGDLLVVNDAATLPASLHGLLGTGGTLGAEVELRLIGALSPRRWWALLMGAGDWHQRTEDRPSPPPLARGDRIRLGPLLTAVLDQPSPLSPRLWTLTLEGASEDALWAELYRLGAPIQYSYLQKPLALWDVQNRYASRPWAVEMPSAGRPLNWELLIRLAKAGVTLATVTHAAGISSTGDPELDRHLPLPERYELSERTVTAIAQTRARGGRVVAVGTSVVRALEGCVADRGRLVAGEGVTGYRIDAHSPLRVVDGLLTGMHEPTASHFALLQAFVPRALLDRAYRHADAVGYLCHEFGDSNLILAERPPVRGQDRADPSGFASSTSITGMSSSIA